MLHKDLRYNRLIYTRERKLGTPWILTMQGSSYVCLQRASHLRSTLRSGVKLSARRWENSSR